MEKRLIVGLGNPGRKYVQTRHNIGFMAIDRLIEQYPIQRETRRFNALYGETMIASHAVLFAKPQTFMNASGESVAAIAHWFKIPVENIIVIYDDLDLPVGRLRIRLGGSSGGHKGIQSIIDRLGANEFYRVRIGIGRPNPGRDAVDHVLERFTIDEGIAIANAIDSAANAAVYLLDHSITETMNVFNGS